LWRSGGAWISWNKKQGTGTEVRCQSRAPYTFVHAFDTDALAAEFADHDVAFSTPLTNTHEGLHGFEISDPDGFVLFFG
jgi:hypothetical protein